MSNNLFKHRERVDLTENYYLESDGFKGIVLVQHSPATRKNKNGEETQYTAEERWYYPNLGLALEKFYSLRQIISPEVKEMLQVQKETIEILKDFKNKWKNW